MKNKRYLFFSLLCLLLLKSCASITEYPETRKVSQIDSLHGIEVEDPYRWLEDFTSEEVGIWVELQNDLSQKYLTKNQHRKRIKENLESIWVSNSKSIPQIRGNHIFYFFNEGSWQQSKLMKQECDTCLPEVIIDPNTFSVDGTVSLSNLRISPNGKFIAYSISDGGSDWKTWKVLDLETNQELEDSIDQLNTKIVEEQNGFIKKKLEQRLATLSGSVGIVKVGANSKVELKEKKDRVEDAIYATKAALQEGIVSGGGVALLNASQKIFSTRGGQVLLSALRSPFEAILDNAGFELESDPEDQGAGLDVVTGEQVDMVKAGIIDPVLVTKTALKNAVSVALTIMSADCVISNVRADESN